MKKYIIIVILIISAYASSPFCEGFKAGYKAGYCYGQYSCMEPMTPMCPMPNMGEETWMDGYNRGFLLGIANKK